MTIKNIKFEIIYKTSSKISSKYDGLCIWKKDIYIPSNIRNTHNDPNVIEAFLLGIFYKTYEDTEFLKDIINVRVLNWNECIN